jgi:hypothetical protein
MYCESPGMVDEEPTDMCCLAYSSECLACADGVDMVTWCTAHKDFDGTGCESVWSNYVPPAKVWLGLALALGSGLGFAFAFASG